MDYLRRGFRQSTRVFKLGCFTQIIVFIIFIIGFSTPQWRLYTGGGGFKDINEGLWRMCSCTKSGRKHCVCGYLQAGENDLFGWLLSVQLLESLGLFLVGVATILNIAAFFTADRVIKVLNFAASLLSGVFILAGVVVYGSRVKDEVHYSFVFTVVALILGVFAAVFVVCDVAVSRRQRIEAPVEREMYRVNPHNKD